MLTMTKLLKRVRFNSRYLFQPPWDTGIPAPEIVRFIKDKTPGNAIDIGCGTGTNLFYLAQHGWRITGIDFAGLAILKARRKLRCYSATLLVADVSKLSELIPPGPFDLAIDMGCFHSLPELDRILYVERLGNLVTPEGMYMLYAFQPSEPTDTKWVSRDKINEYFSNRFDVIQYEQGQGRPSAWYYLKRK